MEKRISMHLILCLLMSLGIACKKSEPLLVEDKVETPVQPVPPVPPADPKPPVTPEPDATVYEVGTGSGKLVIDGNTLTLAARSIIRIKGGNYSSITIANISSTKDNPVLIKNDGLVNIAGYLETDNINNVTIAGDNTPDMTYGFKFENIAYRAIVMSGKMNGVTLKNMAFKNIGDYVITGSKNNGNDLTYRGTPETRTENFKILNCMFDNVGTIQFGGNLNKSTGEDNGLLKDVEIAYNTFQNSSGVGSVCTFTNVQDYNIHHNVVNNINQSSNIHNGVFFMQGNGKFHDNKLTNYQGNSIRMWLYSRDNSPVTNEIYNNVCFNTRKYGAFEIQEFDRHIYPGKSTFANAKVYNNTVGTMNTSKDWEGQILDLYNISGTLEFYNNLGFNLQSKGGSITSMINNMSNTKIIVNTNNKYLADQSSAVSNLTDFASKFASIGAPSL